MEVLEFLGNFQVTRHSRKENQTVLPISPKFGRQRDTETFFQSVET